MQKLLPGYLAALLFLTACQSRNNSDVIISTHVSLLQTNEFLLNNNQLIGKALEEKVKDPQTKQRAIIWESWGRQTRILTDTILRHIDNLKAKLKVHGSAGTKSRLQGEETKQLYLQLIKYHNHIAAVFDIQELEDYPSLQQQVRKDVRKIRQEGAIRLGLPADSVDNDKEDVVWTEWLNGISNPLLSCVALSRIQNDLLTTENDLLMYCNYNASAIHHRYSTFQPLIAMDRSYVKAGERIEVTAGIGEFYLAAKKITIDGKEIVPDDRGMVTHRFTATGRPGKHTALLSIDIVQPDGAEAKVNKLITYTIAP